MGNLWSGYRKFLACIMNGFRRFLASLWMTERSEGSPSQIHSFDKIVQPVATPLPLVLQTLYAII
jgi:hypothetical protein